MCKGVVVDKAVTFMVEIDGTIIIVKNVPARVCAQCGEQSYADEVAHRLESIVNSIKGAITEIAVINYSDEVA